MNDLGAKIEAMLFALGRPMTHAELAKMFGADEQSVRAAIAAQPKAGRGIVMVDDGRAVELRAAPEAAPEIEAARKEQFARDIGRAGIETLAAVLYAGPLSRSEIDFIRGVNSSQVLRTLAMRGLVRKVPNPKDERSFLYEPTTDLLAALGAADLSDLPDYEDIRRKIAALREAAKGGGEENETQSND